MNREQMIQEALGTTEVTAEDLDEVFAAPTFELRKRAFLRLMAGAYERGWDDCDAAYKEAIALSGWTGQLPVGRA